MLVVDIHLLLWWLDIFPNEHNLNKCCLVPKFSYNAPSLKRRFYNYIDKKKIVATYVKANTSNFPCIHVYANRWNLRFKDGSKLLFGFLNFFFCLFFDRSSEFPSSSSSRARFPRTPFSVPLVPFSLHLSFGLKWCTSL